MNSDHNYSAEEFWLEAETLATASQVCLEYFQALGVEAMDIDLPAPVPPASKAGPSSRQAASGEARTQSRPQLQSRPSQSRNSPNGQSRPAVWAPAAPDLHYLSEKAANCQGCSLCKERRHNPVMGRGAPNPLIVFVGQSPAIYDGDAQALLSAMIEKGLQITPDDFYITTILKCSPPNEDLDFPVNAALDCLPLLHRELSLLRPKIVLALGNWPGRLLSGQRNEHLLMLRQQTHSIDGLDGVWLRVTYGLDDLLATPALKKEAWKDLQKIILVINKLRQT
ncbi:hypothetical protein C4J81_08315 [Deltaproteobacteria bacterium Smac51]|nr:hypothetical protein C4J81_08315 [Deltaproteobacteria bacterium Smac51]